MNFRSAKVRTPQEDDPPGIWSYCVVGIRRDRFGTVAEVKRKFVVACEDAEMMARRWCKKGKF